MARKLKDPRRQAQADLISSLRAQAKATKADRAARREAERVAHAESKLVGTAREVYLRELKVPGASLRTVALKYGVTKQAVHAATHGFERERARHRERDKERRPALKREHRCRTCGEVGHNAQRHKDKAASTGDGS